MPDFQIQSLEKNIHLCGLNLPIVLNFSSEQNDTLGTFVVFSSYEDPITVRTFLMNFYLTTADSIQSGFRSGKFNLTQ